MFVLETAPRGEGVQSRTKRAFHTYLAVAKIRPWGYLLVLIPEKVIRLRVDQSYLFWHLVDINIFLGYLL